MENTLWALWGYFVLMIALNICLGTYRSVRVMRRLQAPNKFKPDGSDSPPLGCRLTRALGNCTESFAFVGGPMLFALATGTAAITNPLALYLLAARVGQAVTHVISTSNIAVQIRFAFFAAQVLIVAYWLYLFANKLSF